MRPNPDDLPGALRPIAREVGLEYLPFLPPTVAAFPVACSKLPIFKDPDEIESLPVQMNFHAVALDLDRKTDQEEYERIMTYLASGYGMRLVHIERILVNKRIRRKGEESRSVTRKVRRVLLEYYAPYRVVMNDSTQE